MSGHVISVFGSKGGVGKTVFATNLAAAIAMTSKKRVLLIDMDVHDCGDVALLLGVQPSHTIQEIGPQTHRISTDDFLQATFRHFENFHVLPLVKNVRFVSKLEPEIVERTLRLARGCFDYILIDSGSSMDPLILPVFEVASLVLFLTTPDILSLNRSVVSLQEFQALAFPPDLIEVLVNRYDPKGVITDKMISQKLKKECLALLPFEESAIQSSIHQGIPLFQSQPRNRYSQVIEEIALAMEKDGFLQPVQEGFKLNQPSSRSTLETIAPRQDGSMVQRRVAEELERSDALRLKIHQRLIEVMDFRHLTPEELVKQGSSAIDELRTQTMDAIASIINTMQEIQTREERKELAKQVLDEALGLGPLEDLLKDESVTEILVNRKNQVFVERNGKLTLTSCRFTSDKHLLGVIERIVAPVGRRIDEKTPMVDARLHDGSRVHAIIPPLSIDGPMITIRKFSRKILGPKQLIEMGGMTEKMSLFLKACVESRLNIIISGGTGTGKTTLLNVLSSFIPKDERIITVEDAAELRLPQEHVGRLESRPPNLQGEGAIPIRELVRNTLRMRPDRIIVGECRGAEAVDMLQAMNTGHDGSMTTIHANSPSDCVSRLETLVMFAGLDLPSRAIREQIASAIQLVVQLSRLSDGTRKVTQISEVAGLDDGKVLLHDIFLYQQKGLDEHGRVKGVYAGTGWIPKFLDRFQERGIQIPQDLFSTKDKSK